MNSCRPENAVVLSVKTLSRCLLHLGVQIWKARTMASTSWILMLGSSGFFFIFLLAGRAFPSTKGQKTSD